MCGLYSFRKSAEETRSLFDYLDTPDFPPRSHVAPGGPIAIVRMEQGQRRFALVRWGFIPSWVKELKPGKPLINARGESVDWVNVPSVVLADTAVALPEQTVDLASIVVSGLKAQAWMSPDGSEIETGVIVTTAPNREVAEIHDRMPVVIQPQDYETWLTGEPDTAATLIHPAPDGFFTLEPTRIERNTPPPGARVEKASPQMKLL